MGKEKIKKVKVAEGWFVNPTKADLDRFETGMREDLVLRGVAVKAATEHAKFARSGIIRNAKLFQKLRAPETRKSKR